MISKHVFAFIFSALPSIAMAHDENQIECYPLAHGENGLGSTNFAYIPQLRINDWWTARFYVNNVSEKPVNVKAFLTDNNGGAFEYDDLEHFDNFNDSNSPMNINAGGAILKPGKGGEFTFKLRNKTRRVFGKISWQADACINNALVVSVRNELITPERYGFSTTLLNSGKPF